ncbi:MAG: nuclear transport factor 2 family protein [Pseudomonadota bacterium]
MNKGRYLIPLALVLVLASACGWGESGEIREVRRAAAAYLEAERAGDVEGVWNLLAPSSDFKKGYTLDMYREMASQGRGRIKDYVIEDISGLSSQFDYDYYRGVDRIAEVKVLVTVVFDETGETSSRRTSFTFVKEGGQWYKG